MSKKPEQMELIHGVVRLYLDDDGTARVTFGCHSPVKLDLNKLRDWCQAAIDYEPPFVPGVGERFYFCGSYFGYVRLKLSPDEAKTDGGRIKCLRTFDNKAIWISPDKKFQRVVDDDDDQA